MHITAPSRGWPRLLLLLSVALAFIPPAGAEVGSLADVGAGSLLFRGSEGTGYRPATRLAMDVDIQVSGMLARVQVKQQFKNDGQDWAEGVYVFPLPDNAAVDRLRMRIGERLIEGEIQEKAQARRTYEQAKQSGQRASLVEQERPNLFTTSVANIGPGEQITVEIGYLQTLSYAAGEFRLRFPMTITPRYIPGTPLRDAELQVGGHGWARATDQVPDAPRITPYMQPPGDGPVNPVTLQATIDIDMPLARLESSYHPVRKDQRGGVYHVELQGPVPAERDFELVWAPDVRQAPAAALFTEQLEGRHYALLMIMPPKAASKARLPREAIFVIDTSGSMGGESIRQARQALDLALQRLQPGDRFNVIEFNNHAKALFPHPVPVDSRTRQTARRYINGLSSGGGTEMAPALRLAFAGRAPEGFLRQVMFITDGAVGNEEALFRQITRDLGEARLFTVGIGAAPNAHFMNRAARFGRGTHTFIGAPDEVQPKMAALFAQLEQPVLRDIQVELPAGAEAYPARLPDLYSGQPVVLSVRLPELRGALRVHGRLAGDSWSRTLPLTGGRDHTGVATRWAREKIASLMERQVQGADPAMIRQAVVDVALRHHLVSKYTSLVAVDKTPARSLQARLQRQQIPNNLPAGSDPQAWPMAFAQTATPAPLHLILGLALLLAATLLYCWTPRRSRP